MQHLDETLQTEAPDASTSDAVARQKVLVALGRRAVAPPECSILVQDASSLLAEMLHADFGLAAEFCDDGRMLDVRLMEPSTSESAPSPGRRQKLPTDCLESLVGHVLNVALPTAVGDLTLQRGFTDRFLRKHGVRAAVAAPLKLVDRSFGAIAACFREARHFDDEDVMFVETVSHLVSATIARSQAEQWLADERRMTSGLFDTLQAIVLVLDRSGHVQKTNAACERTTGFSLAEVKGRRLEATLAVPEELYLFQNALGRVLAGNASTEFESRLLTKHSQQRFVAWTMAAVSNGRGEIDAVIATGIDVTRERQLEAKLLTESAAAHPLPLPAAAPDPAGAINSERRKRPRRSYPYRQMIASVVDGKLPEPDSFQAVTCNDIGAGGFSFLTHRPLPSDTLVVALGNPPQLTYLMAKVIHVNRVEQEGKWVFLVGCTYSGRAEY
jgi:PAS domain S-box-containing protein